MANSASTIEVRGAHEHNLKGLDVSIERGSITVITGVSGSGKSSLAFDTILAEAQRRFFYTLSHYSRQFLDLQSRPAVRAMSGLSPAIALAQNETLPSRRATVGTLTDVSELIGVMYARFGHQACPTHGLPTSAMSPDEITGLLVERYEGKTLAICAPVAEAKKGTFKAQLTAFANKGFIRAYVDGEVVQLSPVPNLAREEKHTIKVVIDYVKVKRDAPARLLRAVETALTEGSGFGEYYASDAKGQIALAQGGSFSSKAGCPVCGFSWPRLDSRYFSINSLGRCEDCNGLGVEAAAVYDEDAEDDTDGNEGDDKESNAGPDVCHPCNGTGLDPKTDAITILEKNLRDLHAMPLSELRDFLKLVLGSHLGKNPACVRVAEEVQSALDRIVEVGLGYLTISRRVRSLSGGESQRLKLSGILGENLRGVLYILDEPSQGLHASELETIWRALERLKAGGNTIIIVDHDETMMRKADWIIDLGPGGGARGGRLMAKFRPSEAARFQTQSLTARYLARTAAPKRTPGARGGNITAALSYAAWLKIEGANLHNLCIDAAAFPMGALTVVAGVSGAGKSSLVLSTLYPNLAAALARDVGKKAPKNFWRHCKSFMGHEHVEQASLVDRRPIAKSKSSIPASYLEVFGDLRDLYASLPDAQILGLTARDFSLNVEGGRCPECKGRGELSLSMRFLADARVRCPTCKGHRYRAHVLSVKYADLSINDVLELTLDEAMEHFKNHKRIVARLTPAVELGLGYLKLGQPSSSLSGGEAQRLKLVPHFTKRMGKGSVLILDEPTTGLHFEDVERLVRILRNLVDLGATVITIEHNEDVIRAADYVLEIGPGAASAGGKLTYAGSAKAY